MVVYVECSSNVHILSLAANEVFPQASTFPLGNLRKFAAHFATEDSLLAYFLWWPEQGGGG